MRGTSSRVSEKAAVREAVVAKLDTSWPAEANSRSPVRKYLGWFEARDAFEAVWREGLAANSSDRASLPQIALTAQWRKARSREAC